MFWSENGIIFPSPLKSGDKIALISPASPVKEEYVEGAMKALIQRGYEPVLTDHALGCQSGTYSASKGDRLLDLIDSLQDWEIKAILCTRGGYGCCQMLSDLPNPLISSNPKWIIGFSDVSALLAAWYRSGVASIHGPMCKHLATLPGDDPCTLALFDMLENGGKFDYKAAPHRYNRVGTARGVLRGGNLAVLTDLADTRYDILDVDENDRDVILFFEDISEPIYKVNRMLWRMLLSKALLRVKGIIFGQFTEYRPDANFETMEDMIHDLVDHSPISTDIPIAYNFPVGHVDMNYPLIEGAFAELVVTDTHVSLKSSEIL
ncbi:MAG: LD-carboxypeptidase [Muribaculaceae bacterium]|nr:LD-carboxypeptidase [Muribaculaceae bacterium]